MTHEFRVWAPRPTRVDLLIGENRDSASAENASPWVTLPMEMEQCGWWRLLVPGAGGGTEYSFSLDGGPPRPDPRSEWQPHGIDGPSRVVDHDAYQWGDAGWHGFALASAILYELHVGTFSPEGTFDGVRRHLDHIVGLGVDAIEIMPVAEFGGSRGWGYDGVDLFAPHHRYGGPDGLKRLVDDCHQRQLGVILDVVYNHLGPAGNYLAEFGPYFQDDGATNWGDAVNLDGPSSAEVRRFIIDNALAWVSRYHVDGLRVDAAHALKDSSALTIHEELCAEVHARSGAWVIAESDLNDPRYVAAPELGGYGYDAVWADEFHHAVHAALTRETTGYYEDFGGLEPVVTALRRGWVYTGDYSPHRRRVHGRAAPLPRPDQLVVSLQNHDQVGNRARGERLGHLVPTEVAKIGAALTLLAPFIPMLFAGEEWASAAPFLYFTDFDDPALGSAIRAGRISEFAAFDWNAVDIPDPQALGTYERSKLVWAEAAGDMVDWYRRLIEIRRTIDPGLPTTVSLDRSASGLTLERGGVTLVAALGDLPWTARVKNGAVALLAAGVDVATITTPTLHLPAGAMAIVGYGGEAS
jgi:maltooligosyltrehalose trehalohydrolase